MASQPAKTKVITRPLLAVDGAINVSRRFLIYGHHYFLVFRGCYKGGLCYVLS